MIADLVSSWRANGSFDKAQSSVWRSINERNTLLWALPNDPLALQDDTKSAIMDSLLKKSY